MDLLLEIQRIQKWFEFNRLYLWPFRNDQKIPNFYRSRLDHLLSSADPQVLGTWPLSG